LKKEGFTMDSTTIDLARAGFSPFRDYEMGAAEELRQKSFKNYLFEHEQQGIALFMAKTPGKYATALDSLDDLVSELAKFPAPGYQTYGINVPPYIKVTLARHVDIYGSLDIDPVVMTTPLMIVATLSNPRSISMVPSKDLREVLHNTVGRKPEVSQYLTATQLTQEIVGVVRSINPSATFDPSVVKQNGLSLPEQSQSKPSFFEKIKKGFELNR
jgi:hypothetical protein